MRGVFEDLVIAMRRHQGVECPQTLGKLLLKGKL